MHRSLLRPRLHVSTAIALAVICCYASAGWSQSTDPLTAGGPAGLQKAKVDQAIRLAVEALYRIEPSYTFRDTHILRNQGRSRVYQEIVHEMGNHAVASWAMLAAGEPYHRIGRDGSVCARWGSGPGC